MASTFGQLFRIATWGESHGPAVGVVVDGCPPRVPITAEEIQVELDRRRPGQSRITTRRDEADAVEILSGVHGGLTLGSPIALLVRNTDARSADYQEIRSVFRPSHADFTYQAKYGVRAAAGGGRASARETIGRVASGAIARKLLAEQAQVEIVAYVKQVHTLAATVDSGTVTRKDVDANIVRCPDAALADQMIALIDQARADGDSLGGVVERQHVVHIRVRARDDVDGDHFAHAAGGEAASIRRGLDGGDVATDDRRDVTPAGLLEADEFNLGGFDHCVRAFHHCGKGPRFQ